MKDLEKQIEEYASRFAELQSFKKDSKIYNVCSNSVIMGAKSQAAKEYWQQGMYSEKEVKELIFKLRGSRIIYENPLTDRPCSTTNWTFHNFEEWFGQNKKK